jgi:hypothetical protein
VILKGFAKGSFSIQTVNANLEPILPIEPGFVVLYSFEGGALVCHCDCRDDPGVFALEDLSNLMPIVCGVKEE